MVDDVIDRLDRQEFERAHEWQTVKGKVPSKPNSYKIVTIGGHGTLAKTAELKRYERAFLLQCGNYRNKGIDGRFEFYCRVWHPTMASDLDNSLKILLDCLQMAGAIKNDNRCVRIVAEKLTDKRNPRVEFKIEPVE